MRYKDGILQKLTKQLPVLSRIKRFNMSMALSRSLRGISKQSRLLSTTAKTLALPRFLPDSAKEYPDYHVPKDYIAPPKRDPLKKYDDQQNRRNFEEPVHPYHDYIDMWSPDYFDHVDDKTAVKHFFSFWAGLGLFAGSIYVFDLWPDRPNMPRSYPYEGLYKDLGGREGEQALYQARPDKDL